MNGWLIFAGYLLIMTIVWRVAFTITMDREWEPDRPLAAMMSGLPALFWPVTVAVAPILWFVTRPTPGQRREERERQLQEREREVARLAREYKLPLPKSADQLREQERRYGL